MKAVTTWHSSRLEREVTLARWGHRGVPVLLFPTAGGDAEEIERFHMIDAVSDLVQAGRVKIYSCDSVAGRVMLTQEGSPRHRLWILNQFQEYIRHEVVPAIRMDCRSESIEVVVTGSSIGAILAPPVVAWILLTWGWPSAFLSIGLLGFVWLLIWWPVYRTPRAIVPEIAAARVPPWTLFRTRFVWSLTLSKVFFDPVWYFYIFWFPEYLKNARHFDMASIGKYGWIPFAVAGLGNVFGGALSALLLRRGCSLIRRSRVLVSSNMMAASASTCAGSHSTDSTTPGLESREILKLFVDQRGGLWVAMATGLADADLCTLRGAAIASEFKALVETYIEKRYGPASRA